MRGSPELIEQNDFQNPAILRLSEMCGFWILEHRKTTRVVRNALILVYASEVGTWDGIGTGLTARLIRDAYNFMFCFWMDLQVKEQTMHRIRRLEQAIHFFKLERTFFPNLLRGSENNITFVWFNVGTQRAIALERKGLLRWNAKGYCVGTQRAIALERKGLLRWNAKGYCVGTQRAIALERKGLTNSFDITIFNHKKKVHQCIETDQDAWWSD